MNTGAKVPKIVKRKLSTLRGRTSRPIGEELPDPSQALGMSMLRARETIVAPIRPILRSYKLTDQSWRILRILVVEPTIAPTSLARRTVIQLPSLSRIIKDLQSRGWVDTGPAGEGRRPKIWLTSKGRSLVGTVYPQIYEKQEPIRKIIGKRNIDQLLVLLHRIEAIH